MRLARRGRVVTVPTWPSRSRSSPTPEPACRAVVAARVNAPGTEEALLRRLRVRTMLGGLLDDPDLIAGAAREAGIDPDRLRGWCASEEITLALGADMTAARRPAPAADALDHKLGGPREERRYTAPSYEIARTGDDGATVVVPGFNPVEAYEVAIANLAASSAAPSPGRSRRSSRGRASRWRRPRSRR